MIATYLEWETHQTGWNGASESIIPQIQYFKVAQESQTGWNCAIQVILIEEKFLCNKEEQQDSSAVIFDSFLGRMAL